MNEVLGERNKINDTVDLSIIPGMNEYLQKYKNKKKTKKQLDKNKLLT